ncbi:hypothetical protein B7P43_G13386 [Cryptotermes secundus]|uniref:Uncharacterized protein n=1 Tax=Cryptotermes secundus TaxID=105785 RepID=A0A2J7RKW0_9NEOP|nr:hypothetical protein B7P43_G13386 [Cryptotermes secundus]
MDPRRRYDDIMKWSKVWYKLIIPHTTQHPKNNTRTLPQLIAGAQSHSGTRNKNYHWECLIKTTLCYILSEPPPHQLGNGCSLMYYSKKKRRKRENQITFNI